MTNKRHLDYQVIPHLVEEAPLLTSSVLLNDFLNSFNSWDVIDPDWYEMIPWKRYKPSKSTDHRLQKHTKLLTLPLDVKETEKHYEVLADVPGIEKENVKITVKDHILTIQTERQSETKSESDNYHRVERFRGSSSRSLRLPENVNEDEVEASFTNGVLSIKIPKTKEVESEKVKTIQIQ
jgi:HSP20 family protein